MKERQLRSSDAVASIGFLWLVMALPRESHSKEFDLKINRSMKTPWQKYTGVSCSYSSAPDSLNSKNLKYEIQAKKARKSERNQIKYLVKMGCCVTPCGKTDVGSSQTTFLAFSRTSKHRHWSKLSTKEFFFLFFLTQRKILLSGENIFILATLSAIIYHIRSN